MDFSNYKEYFDFNSLIKKIEGYIPDFNKNKFIKAFSIAEKAHEGQLRKDKKTPYFVHPVKVVEILSKIHADEDILISAILHDVPEDTKFDIHEVKKIFGENLASFKSGGFS